MRITKQIAESVSKKLTEKKKSKVDQLFKDYQQAVTAEYLKQTPIEVKETFKAHPEFFQTVSNISFSGHGFRWENVSATEPVIKKNSGSADLQLTEAMAAKFVKLKNKYEDAKKQYKSLLSEIENALFNLRTYSNVEKNIPEAAEFLPKEQSMALAINFSDIRNRIKAA